MDPTTIQKIVRGEMNSDLFVVRMTGTNPELIPFSVLEKEMKAFWSRIVATKLRNGENLPSIWDVLGLERTTLEDLRFLALQREAFQTQSLITDPERIRRAKALFENLIGKENYEECIKLLGQDPETTSYLMQLPQFFEKRSSWTPPSLAALLEFKDLLAIPDQKWNKYVVNTLNLDSSSTLTYVVRERRRQTEEIEPELTFGKRGHELKLIKLLQKLIETRPPPSNDQPLPIKFAFDGSRVMKRKIEIGTVDPLWDVSKDGAKSPLNSYQFIIFLGEESNKVMKEELTIALPVIKYLIDGGEVEVKRNQI